ncbi:MAG: squalene/phytoene synthase family protein [Devosiaceae bacterium]|nr:squalene/phytoene synthase family protein [Devosiaceae bacterium]
MTKEIIAKSLKLKDKERYYSTLILPKKHQQTVQVLYAFNAEISAISHMVKEPQMGEIRLTYWREILEGKAHGNIEKNPIASAIIAVLTKYNMPNLPLIRLVEARRFDLYNDKMPSMAQFEGYAGETSSILFQYSAMILNDGQELANGDVAGHLGVAQALIGHILAFEFNLSQQKLYLPLEHFNKVSISEAEVFGKEKADEMRAVLFELLEIAQQHLDKASLAIAKLERNIRPAFASIIILNKQIKAIRKVGLKPFNSIKKLSEWQMIWHLALWTIKNG